MQKPYDAIDELMQRPMQETILHPEAANFIWHHAGHAGPVHAQKLSGVRSWVEHMRGRMRTQGQDNHSVRVER